LDSDFNFAPRVGNKRGKTNPQITPMTQMSEKRRDDWKSAGGRKNAIQNSELPVPGVKLSFA